MLIKFFFRADTMGYTFLPSLLVEKFGVLNTIRFPSEVCLTLLDMAK